MSNISALSCAEVRELAPELALGILSGAEHAEVLLHVNGCARCQAYVAELTEAADVIPQLAPRGRAADRVRGAGAPPVRWPRAPHPSTVDRGRGRRRRRGDHREHHRGAGRSSRTTPADRRRPTRHHARSRASRLRCRWRWR